MKLLDLLLEEYANDGRLYGYHVTNISNIESIIKNGFRPGERSMQGKGFYAFYDEGHARRYNCKDVFSKERAIIKFEILNKDMFIYLDMDIAKKVLGEEYHLKYQIDRYYKSFGGLEYFLKNYRLVMGDNEITMEDLIEKLDYIENRNDELVSRGLWADMMPMTMSDKLNLVHRGAYGLEYRINWGFKNLELINYTITDCSGNTDIKSLEYNVLDDIPDTGKFKKLREFIIDNNYTNYKKGVISNKITELIKKTENLSDKIKLYTISNLLYDLIFKEYET
jgi:hypothetical protein